MEDISRIDSSRVKTVEMVHLLFHQGIVGGLLRADMGRCAGIGAPQQRVGLEGQVRLGGRGRVSGHFGAGQHQRKRSVRLINPVRLIHGFIGCISH